MKEKPIYVYGLYKKEFIELQNYFREIKTGLKNRQYYSSHQYESKS